MYTLSKDSIRVRNKNKGESFFSESSEALNDNLIGLSKECLTYPTLRKSVGFPSKSKGKIKRDLPCCHVMDRLIQYSNLHSDHLTLIQCSGDAKEKNLDSLESTFSLLKRLV